MGCSNTPENEEAVRKAVAATLERNPSAFRAKINISPKTTGGGVLLAPPPLGLLSRALTGSLCAIAYGRTLWSRCRARTRGAATVASPGV